MKTISWLSFLPILVALGACSGGGGSTSHSASNTGDGGAGGDDSGDAGNPATPYEAKMSGANVTSPIATSATGDAKFQLEPDGQTLTYDITQNVSGATSVDLHIGAPLEDGTVTHQLTPVSAHMTGKVTLTGDEQTAIQSDQIYVDVASGAHPGGEIRGQLTSPGSTIFVAMPSGAQEVPAVKSTYAAHASFILSSDQTSVIYHVVTTAVPTNVLLERAIGSINGQVVYPLTPAGQTVDGNVTLAASDPDDFNAAHFYVNIQTQENPTGELRGQVIPPGATFYTGVLSGTNEVPSVKTQATGGAQFVLGADGKTLNYEVVVSGIIPTAAEIDAAPKGQDGPALYQLTLNQTGAQGSLMVSSSDVSTMGAGGTYVNVHTASYPTGELRAQMLQQ